MNCKDNYSFEDFLEVVATLRSENGCEWDKKQTYESLLRYLVEEAYEYIEAVNQGEREKQADELGDILLQVVLHSQIGKERGDFTIEDVINCVAKKMIYRHPHVFSDTKVNSVDDILLNWEELKRKEQNGKTRKEMLLGITKAVPALIRGQKVVEKVKKHEKYKKNSYFNKESLDKVIKMLDNGEVFSGNSAISEKIGQAFLSLIYIASEHKISVELLVQDEIDKLINAVSD